MTGRKQKKQYNFDSVIFFGLGAFSVFVLGAFGFSTAKTYTLGDVSAPEVFEEEHPPEPKVVHLPTPEPLRAIYMTQCVAGSRDFRERLVHLATTTEINALVIDVKDYTGRLGFVPKNPELRHAMSPTCRASDMEDFLSYLHQLGIYTIARITVFQDPYLSQRNPELAVKKESNPEEIWKDFKGISYLDPASREVWDYIVSIGREAYELGFDELNFDYIRFPSDGNMTDISFPHTENRLPREVIREFFSYLSLELRETGPILSADLFGMTTTGLNDLNIGQILEYAFPYFDYIAPMVYPSHYPPEFNGWPNPNDYPYEIVHHSMSEAVKRAEATTTRVFLPNSPVVASTSPALYIKESYDRKKLRPWLQDFDYGGDYGPVEVRKQIQATYDSGLDSWMLWSPSNIYTWQALESSISTSTATTTPQAP